MQYVLVFLICILTALLTACHPGSLSPRDIPRPILSTFQSAYPDAKRAKWTATDDGLEVEFRIKGVEKEVKYDKNGKVTEIETEIRFDDLPQPAKNYLEKYYPGYEVRDVDRIENGNTLYEVELESGDIGIEVIFDSAGNFLREEVDETDDNGGDM